MRTANAEKPLAKIEDELEQLALRYPKILGADGFTSKVKGKRRRELKSIRNCYYAALRELAEVVSVPVQKWHREKDCLLMSWRH